MDNLPREIVANILSRLPIKPLIRCKSVCKSFLNLTHDPYFINTHLNHASSHNEENPGLILNTTILNGATHFRSQLYYATQTLTNFSCDEIPFNFDEFRVLGSCNGFPFSPLNFDEFRVLGSCNGLLCLLHRTIVHWMLVINPCTGKQIEIPKLIIDRTYGYASIGFGFSPKSNEYKLLMFSGYSPSYVLSLSEGVWRAVGTPSFSFKIRGSFKPNVCVNGVIHWQSYVASNPIVCFDVAGEVFDVIAYPAAAKLRDFRFFLAEFSGCLGVVVYEENNCIDIWVMKEHNVVESWSRSFTINMNHIGWDCRYVQDLFVQKNGEVLMLYKNEALWFYSPKTMTFRKANIVGLPSWFEVICHVGSLVSPLGY